MSADAKPADVDGQAHQGRPGGIAAWISKNRDYLRLGAMIATSTAVMFVLMYLNTYQLDHVRWSETRFYMAFVMGSAMGVIMLGYMWGMYSSRLVNLAVIVGSVAIGSERPRGSTCQGVTMRPSFPTSPGRYWRSATAPIRSTARGSRATRSTCPPARETSWSPRSRWPSHTEPSRTAAPW